MSPPSHPAPAVPLTAVYLVQRHDYGPHYSDEVERKHVHSIHITKAAANKKAKVFVCVIRRDEDTNHMARLEIEDEGKRGYYYTYLELNQDMADDGIHHTEVTVSKMFVRDEDEGPYSDEEEIDDFASEVEDDDYHPKEKTAHDLENERAMERLKEAFERRDVENARKRRRL
jgi:hypothetical protein